MTIRFPFRYSVSPLAVLSRHIEFPSHSKATLFHMEVRQRFQKHFLQSRPLQPRYIKKFKTGEPRWKYFHTHKKTRNQFLQFRLQKPIVSSASSHADLNTCLVTKALISRVWQVYCVRDCGFVALAFQTFPFGTCYPLCSVCFYLNVFSSFLMAWLQVS